MANLLLLEDELTRDLSRYINKENVKKGIILLNNQKVTLGSFVFKKSNNT